ncbi:uncharacterized protein EDB93DRAFT_1253728 [Suillus bovinus]|uniref:uncharacterized protein n=1 Tax=Suillus bovinus TaxID=48563 RepID=UPI001B87B1B0|nr:uncharacterized protein EDB93DRAFT_1253728 [Suillus bovinus]KAG2137114.1 hypothetical protein EDB93DRAFT_1253728 [Suillus bovinus]
MGEAAESITQMTIPVREFEAHIDTIRAVAAFPDGRRIVTGSVDKTLHLWDLKEDVVLKKLEGHRNAVRAIAVSRDGQFIASGDYNGELIAWDSNTGNPLTQIIKAHFGSIYSLDFSADGVLLATGSLDGTVKLWSTTTWHLQGNPIDCHTAVYCIRYAPSGEHLAIATFKDVQILITDTKECIANFTAHAVLNLSLAWMPDGSWLLSASTVLDPTIRVWDPSTWKQVGDPWTGHTYQVNAIAVNSTGTLVASASDDKHVRLWRLSDRRTIAIFKHSDNVYCVAFSIDGKHIISGSANKKVSQWAVPEIALLENSPQKRAVGAMLLLEAPSEQSSNNILALGPTVRDACISGDLATAEEFLTQEIKTDGNNYNSYANRSFLMARKLHWDSAIHDALKSISIQPSLTGHISKGIAFCGMMNFEDAMKAFDLASIFTRNSQTVDLLLIKAIALFNANQHEDAMRRVQEIAATCPDADVIVCRTVEAYLHVQLGIDVLDSARYDEAVDHFTTAINLGAFLPESINHSRYGDFTVLFGWDFRSLWQIANQKRCRALLHASRPREALKSYRYMMDTSDDATKASCVDWCTAFKEECSMLYAANGVADLAVSGDAALAAGEHDRAIEIYSAAIDLDSATYTIFANRSKARSEKMLWEDALSDAQQVIELNPSSYLGYEVKSAALHGAQLYDEAIEAFKIMISKLENAPKTELRQKFVDPFEADSAIRKVVHTHLDDAPLRLLDTHTGRLCDREAQINAFKSSTEYKELLSSILRRAELRIDVIQNVAMTYFRCVMLSHRWEVKELLLHDIQDKVVYELNPVGGIMKLQSFCKTTRGAGHRWGWIDACCIDQTNNAELQKSLNSMFVWYRHSVLTIVYLSDVAPSSKSGALAKSTWNTRGWTVPEFLAPKVVLFYQNDWTLYLDDHSPNHKESPQIMQELKNATAIDARALVDFRPGMRRARERLQWVSRRVTTLQEDIAYSLFGIFGVQLPIMYGEKKQNALGRLLQEIVAQSGDITALDWVGRSSEFNSCLPADITSYAAPPYELPSISEDEMRTSVSALRDSGDLNLAVELYSKLDYLSAPRFANRRLHLPCIVFPVKEVRRRPSEDQETHITYQVKADKLHDLAISTQDRLLQFSHARPTRQSFLLVRPWNRHLLGLPDFEDNGTQCEDDWILPGSPSQDSHDEPPEEQELDDLELIDRAFQLIVRLGQPFNAFLLAQQRGGEYKRIASDHDIIAQVKDIGSVYDVMDVRTLEIL